MRLRSRHNISLGFSTPPEGRALVYQIDVPLNHYSESAPIKLRMPTEQGSSVAHRRFKDELLRVYLSLCQKMPMRSKVAGKLAKGTCSRSVSMSPEECSHHLHKDTR